MVLEKISEDTSKEDISANKDKINRIYEHISDTFDFSADNTADYILAQQWGQSHKILSKEGYFEFPKSLNLLSSRLSGVELSNQVFHAKHLENERFASFLMAIGVNMISKYREELNGVKHLPEINTMFIRKVDFLTSISTGNSFTENTWEETKSKLIDTIANLEFYQTDSIYILSLIHI